MNPPSDKESTDGGSAPKDAPRIKSAFEDRSPTPSLKRRRRLGEDRVAAAPVKAGVKGCGVCGGAHPTRMCDRGK